jgi:hypothetical protein
MILHKVALIADPAQVRLTDGSVLISFNNRHVSFHSLIVEEKTSRRLFKIAINYSNCAKLQICNILTLLTGCFLAIHSRLHIKHY